MKKIHYQSDILEHFIPISLERLISDLLDSDLLIPLEHHAFKKFCSSYISVFHAQAHKQLQSLKHIYQPFNPDRDSLIIEKTETSDQLIQLKSELYAVLKQANYQRISEDDLNKALNKISPHGVKVSVDFEEFIEVGLFCRGSAIQTKYHRNWKKLSFKKQPINIQTYRRLFILLQPRTRQQWIEHLTKNKKLSLKKAEKTADAALKTLGITGETSVIYMKLFKDIPRSDLEMLFPNTRIQMRLFDKFKLGIIGGGGTAGGIFATITKLSAAIDPISAIIAVGTLLGVLWRQISKIFRQRAKYNAILTKNLYFYSLNTNMGALTYLVDSAKTEECKEAILAYFFLLVKGKIDRQKLDKHIESYLQEKYSIPMDFEIDDSLTKLLHSNLVSQDNEVISAVSLDQANIILIQQWNHVIQNNTIFVNGD